MLRMLLMIVDIIVCAGKAIVDAGTAIVGFFAPSPQYNYNYTFSGGFYHPQDDLVKLRYYTTRNISPAFGFFTQYIIEPKIRVAIMDKLDNLVLGHLDDETFSSVAIKLELPNHEIYNIKHIVELEIKIYSLA